MPQPIVSGQVAIVTVWTFVTMAVELEERLTVTVAAGGQVEVLGEGSLQSSPWIENFGV